MDTPRLRNRVLLDLATGGWTIGPAVVGGTLLAAAAAVAGPGAAAVTAFAGLSSLLIAGGAAATRWFLGGPALVERAMAGEASRERARREADLDALDRRLVADGDDRTQTHLRRLRALHQRLWGGEEADRPPTEILLKAEELFRFAVSSLQQSLRLHDAAGGLATRDARLAVEQRRDRLVREVGEGVDQLARTLDQIQLLKLEPGAGPTLAALRGELDASLAVARRVDARLRGLDPNVEAGPLRS